VLWCSKGKIQITSVWTQTTHGEFLDPVRMKWENYNRWWRRTVWIIYVIYYFRFLRTVKFKGQWCASHVIKTEEYYKTSVGVSVGKQSRGILRKGSECNIETNLKRNRLWRREIVETGSGSCPVVGSNIKPSRYTTGQSSLVWSSYFNLSLQLALCR
jgi:hypothetical protein